MAIKDILTIVDTVGTRPAANAVAELANRLDAHLTGAVDRLSAVAAGRRVGGYRAFRNNAVQAWKDQAKAADMAFQEIARRSGIRFQNIVMEESAEGRFTEVVRLSRLTDLVVVGQDNPSEPEPMRSPMIESLLFEGGAPMLLIPYIGLANFSPSRALIGWDGSSATAARAVRASLPLLRISEEVTVATVSDERSRLASDLAVYLDRQGLKVEVKLIPNRSIAVADALLNTVADEGFDFMVMGGYGHSRIREYLFGGATRDILREMTVPVLMTH